MPLKSKPKTRKANTPKHERTRSSDSLERLVRRLSDPYEFNWCDQTMISRRSVADDVLAVMSREGVIDGRRHKLGGWVWRVGNALYGRTDDVTLDNFDELQAV